MRHSSVVIGTLGKGRKTTMFKEMVKRHPHSILEQFFPIQARYRL
ncbi:hypothetical protein [Alkalicoccobacillus gibsonii]|nr:hypothetical protein [Alkalicoccobacillus gibsonii]